VQRLLRQASDFVHAQPLGSMAVFIAGLLAGDCWAADRSSAISPVSADCGHARGNDLEPATMEETLRLSRDHFETQRRSVRTTASN
jgi:hypothetical protein